ncbi:AT-rich interactive domain-containing protein 1A [Eurytemora carolleeae]|uniref:AT-rich interactive domain-containing protein 1A n=1 Tax=Eurytemora carolleeae TaxID=1294199 RepID=UPI000C75AE7B|nr:AT-rich interactive domain-containing protein 1A [Eurytemora carolleeae]|eukprot:XP_023332681.1 AT-rich interactive domain-containing protein 1A-like [Eurytemora affinis]
MFTGCYSVSTGLVVTMFHLKSLVFVCCVGSLTSQTFFRTSLGGGGSYSSVSHGAHSGPAGHAGQPTQQVYKVQPVKPAYQQPIYQQPTYQQPAYQKPVYQQPSYQQPSYKQPSYQQPIEKSPEVPTYGEKCTLSYEEKYVQVCVPELETACKPEKLKNGNLLGDKNCVCRG